MTHDVDPFHWVGAPRLPYEPRHKEISVNPLQSVPGNVRTALYWSGYVLGLLGQGITVVWAAVAAASPSIEMPLWLVIASAVIGLLTTQLNLLAGSNVVDTQTVTVTAPADAPTTVRTEIRGNQAGIMQVRTAFLVIGTLIVVLVLAAAVAAFT